MIRVRLDNFFPLFSANASPRTSRPRRDRTVWSRLAVELTAAALGYVQTARELGQGPEHRAPEPVAVALRSPGTPVDSTVQRSAEHREQARVEV